MILGIQIPQDILDIDNLESKAKYILIIEKNASFQKIINEGLLKKNKSKFVMITVSYLYKYCIYYIYFNKMTMYYIRFIKIVLG